MPIPLSVVVPALLVAPPTEHAAHGVDELAGHPARVGGERGVALRAGMGLDWRRFLFHGGLLGLFDGPIIGIGGLLLSRVIFEKV